MDRLVRHSNLCTIAAGATAGIVHDAVLPISHQFQKDEIGLCISDVSNLPGTCARSEICYVLIMISTGEVCWISMYELTVIQ